MSKNYSLVPSARYFGSVEGQLRSPLFGTNIKFAAKNSDGFYAERCAAHFESITAENLGKFPALYKALTALCDYVVDLLDENSEEYDLEDFDFDEDADIPELLNAVFVSSLIFERVSILSEEECPIAYTVKLALKPVPDELMEIAVRGDEAIYAGENNNVSPWNDKLLKKKYNYLRGK